MKNVFILILILGLLQSCSEEDMPVVTVDSAQPAAMNVYCQKNPDDIFKRIEFDYENGTLIAETTLIKDTVYSKRIFQYGSDRLLTKETYEADGRITEKIFEYNESKQLINIHHKIIDYDPAGNVENVQESDAPLEYENGLLVKKWEFWGGFNTYEYENGKLITKVDYTKNGQRHHITNYKYSGDLKIEEKKETAAGRIMYTHFFQYDTENRLTKIVEGENTIEENFYDGNKLIEKKTYYFGIDPGYDPCYGNYIYKYEY